jgi:transcriptional regulator with XRE-family HTH domain
LKVGAILQAIRVRANLTQEDIAHTFNMSQSCISKIEKDRKPADFQIILKWAELTNAKEVVVAYIYGMDGISILQNISQLIG